ncbi:hypothetical protein Tco_0614987 [Tanacetum coccineum]
MFNQRSHFSKSHSPVRRPIVRNTARISYSHAVKGNWGTDHPLKNMVDRGIFDSGCSGHMTGNKDQLEDFEEFNGGSVTFRGSKGYISGKGKIRVGAKGLTSPEQTATGKGISNPFMAIMVCQKPYGIQLTNVSRTKS